MNNLTHGLVSTYTNHGCRCDECREAASSYTKELRARRKGGDPIRSNGRGQGRTHGTRSMYVGGCRCGECKQAQADYVDERTYGLKPGERAEMLKRQGGCAACGITEDESEGRWHIDHDHDSGAVRGVLCHGCNVALGFAGESPSRLRGIADYIEASKRWDVL